MMRADAGSRARRDLLILVLAFLVSLPLVTTRIYASDEVQYFSYLRSLWFDHDVSFENEYRYFYDAGITHYELFRETFLERRTDETGLRVSFATIGSALLWSPFYGAADLIVRVRRALGSSVAADGFSTPYVAAVAYGSAFYGWLAVVLGWHAARRLIGEAGALAAALAVWFGTPLLFYMYVAPPMSHACSAFAAAAFFVVWLRVRASWTPLGCAALGALAALMGMVREQDVFIAIGPIVDWAWTTIDSYRRQAATRLSPVGPWEIGIRVAAAGAAFLMTYSPQLWAYTVLNGYPGPSRLVGRKMTWTSPHALGVLLSTEHGLIFWTPLVALSLAGLVWMALGRGTAAAHARVAVCLLLSVASQVYIAGSVESWSVAGAFGQRRFLGLTLVFCVGLAAACAIARTRFERGAVAAVFALGVWWNLGLTAQYGSGLMDRQRLELGRNAYHTFATIPARLPDLAYRYVFERSSFYKAPPIPEP